MNDTSITVDQKLELWVKCHEDSLFDMSQEKRVEAIKELDEIIEGEE